MPLSRRELLTRFLGAPVAAAAVGCGVGTPKLPPAGDFVGQLVSLGHRLRGGPLPTFSSDKAEDVDVLIVGGGIAGLSAARRLAASDVNFLLLELEPEAGGTSLSGESELVGYPWGAHYVPVPFADNTQLVELFDEMGILEGRGEDGSPIVAEQFLCRDPHERLFVDGQWHEGLFPWAIATDADVAQLQQFKERIDEFVGWRAPDGRRAFTIPVAECSTADEILQLDQQTMAAWLRASGLTSPLLHWYVDYCCRDDYGLTVEQTSAWAGLFYFAARKQAPGEDSQPFVTWPEGNGRIVNHLRSLCADRVRSGHLVTEIAPVESDHRSSVEVVAIDTADGSQEVRCFRAKEVIFAAPTFLAPRLIRDYQQARPSSAGHLQFGSWLVANLHLTQRPVEHGFPLSWDSVLYDSPSLGYVAATHQQLVDHGPTVLTYYYPLCDDDPRVARQRLLDLSWEQWADVVLTDLEQAHPEIRSLTSRLDIMRWGHAMVRPVPGVFSGPARQECSQPFGNVHFAHSALSGVALFEEAFYHGNRAASEALGSLSASV
ncbi:MAG: flavin monoamine oxidase family protein [Planctomycetota bacterium]